VRRAATGRPLRLARCSRHILPTPLAQPETADRTDDSVTNGCCANKLWIPKESVAPAMPGRPYSPTKDTAPAIDGEARQQGGIPLLPARQLRLNP
jgi:hypothetical protein